ncbi:Haloacid dehalogenase superfamily, subfamily IA, variant 2 with 3rd motif like haloacid dehalogenase/haloacid dehalogenase superfamily, subfamily IA, variant 3 with third motif having DD or ED [Microlunatus soli]|uniref:Haloacid dehalogenase superfamily, subfamily IA, variant 2 with 3rd motif like haloacid dehalogenase/haloacid dehalogenase superfamily, subfamily IA, variant 3 with third motif having DD or ED n=1 Tax=Microlunatus soli TaxID=630515 RepID=A0A1H1S570_9ACTN|nr:Haloacid dehalogenase superfamily, subfamily IA, variant 2 with 3rd motif like haloacid dehalogenase/haloacid dehalogenase superfamily, subfamily IA, variant 3 with third motif having DD or ED [Microlunatus soli]
MTWAGGFGAVVFDLFGTLVPVFGRPAHQDALREVAVILDIPYDDVERLWSRTYRRRVTGGFGSVADNLRWICDHLGTVVGDRSIDAAAGRYAEFTRRSVTPSAEVVAALREISEPIGLLTNCAPDVPDQLSRTPLAEVIDAAIFSGRDGVAKPDPEAYRRLASRLGVEPTDIVYVGDGSDHELSGAAAVGMHPCCSAPIWPAATTRSGPMSSTGMVRASPASRRSSATGRCRVDLGRRWGPLRTSQPGGSGETPRRGASIQRRSGCRAFVLVSGVRIWPGGLDFRTLGRLSLGGRRWMLIVRLISGSFSVRTRGQDASTTGNVGARECCPVLESSAVREHPVRRSVRGALE